MRVAGGCHPRPRCSRRLRVVPRARERAPANRARTDLAVPPMWMRARWQTLRTPARDEPRKPGPARARPLSLPGAQAGSGLRQTACRPTDPQAVAGIVVRRPDCPVNPQTGLTPGGTPRAAGRRSPTRPSETGRRNPTRPTTISASLPPCLSDPQTPDARPDASRGGARLPVDAGADDHKKSPDDHSARRTRRVSRRPGPKPPRLSYAISASRPRASSSPGSRSRTSRATPT